MDNLIDEKQKNTGKIQNLEAIIKRQELMVEVLQAKKLSKHSKQHLIFPNSSNNVSLLASEENCAKSKEQKEELYCQISGKLKSQLFEIDKKIQTQKAALTQALFSSQC